MKIKLEPPISSENLLLRMQTMPTNTHLIEGLLYEHDTLMVGSDSGKGKSLLSLQIAMHLTKGSPVFGALHVARPLRVWYMQMERHENESLERMIRLQDHVAWDPANFFLDTEVQCLDFINPDHYETLEERGFEIKPDVIFIDPLYGVAQGLSQDKIASSLSKVFTMLKKRLGCALWLNHHTLKDQYNQQGEKIEREDPFYGATWLRAHVTGSYFMRQNDTGTSWVKKKDNHGILLDQITTIFDDETYFSSIDPTKMNYKDRFRLFINMVFSRPNKTFEFEECRAFLGCAVRHLRDLLSAHHNSEAIKRHKANGKKTLYEVLRVA